MAIKLLIFDLDGTLIDSAPDIADAANIYLRSRGKSELPFELIRSHIGEGPRLLIKSFFPEIAHDTQELDKIDHGFLEQYKKQMFNKTRVYDGIHEFLQTWPHKMGIVTNKPIHLTHPILEHLKLSKHPWVDVYGADTFEHKKPHPLPLLKMIEKAQVHPSEALMIGDGTPDMESAKNAGIKSLAIEFGYGSYEKLSPFGPVGFLSHYKDLSSWIDRINLL